MQNQRILRNLVALSIIPGLGFRRLRHLLEEQEKLESVFELSKSMLRMYEGLGEASALSILTFDDWEEVDRILRQTDEAGARLISIADDAYPELLKQIYDPPLLLWLKGTPGVLSLPGVAVIGTRNPTAYGKKQAYKFSSALASMGFCINSGLAYGIDVIAHRAALDTGDPTIAVLGSGIDNIYPRKHLGIANQIIENGGVVITEFPLGTNPDAVNFPVRNRIVSGLSLGVLVIESGIQGGSMITAELGLDQNREIFAVPHDLNNMAGTGGNHLIKKGTAKLVQTVDDILQELPVDVRSLGGEHIASAIQAEPSWKDDGLDDLSYRICERLEERSYQLDELSEGLQLHSSRLLVALLQLEMKGWVQQYAGKNFKLTKP